MVVHGLRSTWLPCKTQHAALYKLVKHSEGEVSESKPTTNLQPIIWHLDQSSHNLNQHQSHLTVEQTKSHISYNPTQKRGPPACNHSTHSLQTQNLPIHPSPDDCRPNQNTWKKDMTISLKDMGGIALIWPEIYFWKKRSKRYQLSVGRNSEYLVALRSKKRETY